MLSFALLSIILLSFIGLSLQGTISPYGTNPIQNTIANRNQYADYTFYYTLETPVEAGGKLYITFPFQYIFGLGILSTPSCSLPCKISGYTVILTYDTDVLSGVVNTVTINQVANPTNKGGTGNFKLQTYKTVNLIDENLVFGVIGVADTIGQLTSTSVALDSSGTSKAGEVSRYSFSFKTSQIIPGGSYMRFVIQDTNFGLSDFPSCAPFAINGKIVSGKFTCETQGQYIIVTGLDADIPANQDVGFSVSMTNPKFSGTTQPFDIEILRDKTTVVYDQKLDVPGVPITGGIISNIKLDTSDTTLVKARSKVMDYHLTFLLKNGLAEGSVITLEFPATFTIISDANPEYKYYVRYGLEDISESSPVGMSLTGNTLTISNFQGFSIPSEISVFIRARNPATTGQTTPVKIRSYTTWAKTVLVDEDITKAFVTIAAKPQGSSHSITGQGGTYQTETTIAALTFNIEPSISIPTNGYIKIKIPSTFVVSSFDATTDCQNRPFGSGWSAAASCTRVDNLITFRLSATFPLGSTSSFRLNNFVTTPTNNGSHLFDITSYGTAGVTVLESWSDYFIIAPSAFASSTVSSICLGDSRYTVLEFTVETNRQVPAGITQTSALDTKGFIEFEFTGHIDLALGTGYTEEALYPCRPTAGLIPISGKILCYLIPGTAIPATNPKIIVENFQLIPASTKIKLEFPKIQNSNANYGVTAKTISLYNRIRTQLNEVSLTVTVNAQVAYTENAAASNPYIWSSNEVSTFTSLEFVAGTATVQSGPGKFIVELPFYDVGWIPESNTVACQLEGVYGPCTRYDGADWVVIPLLTGQTFNPGDHIKLENIRYPRHRNTAKQLLVRYIRDSDQQEIIRRPQTTILPADVPEFILASLLVDKKGRGMVDSRYRLTFASQNEIPEGSIITITFPTAYNLLSSYPPVAFESPNLIDISDSQPVSYSPTASTVSITDFQTIPAETSFTIIATGVKNPTSLATSQQWDVEVTLDGELMVEHTDFDRFVFTPLYTSNTITFNGITAFPSNAEVEATYTIDFVPASQIPVGGEIRITFPTGSFTTFSSSSKCRVYGGITTFAQCKRVGNQYKIELDSTYSTGDVQVEITGVMNPSAGETDGFIVKTFYDGIFLDTTATSDTTGRTATITDEPLPISVKYLKFDPRNEGEESTYEIAFVPTTPLTSENILRIVFPSVYDALLGFDVTCASIGGIIGDFTCDIADRVMTVSGFDDYTPDSDNPIIMQIYGVINPNKDINADTGQFKIATLIPNSDVFIDYTGNAGSLEIEEAPGWSILYNITAENLDTRLDSYYKLNFTTSIDVPSEALKGSVFVDFPSQFEIADSDLTCSSETDDFASELTCNVLRNRVYAYGNDEYSGNIIMQVDGIENPVEPETADSIIVKTYDGFNKIILERSYKNLDPFEFTYEYPGPLITVNNNEPIRVDRGTQSQDLYITLEFPCALNLTLNPITPGFSIIPFNIDLSLGKQSATFRVSIPGNFEDGTYFVEWQTLNELSPPFYTPIKKTEVIVTNLQSVRIDVPTLFEIPQNGNSLPAYFEVDYGPNIGFEIILTFAEDYPGIGLDRRNVIFRAGTQSSSFIVYSTDEDLDDDTPAVERGSILLEVTGVNNNVYQLSSSSIEFQIIEEDDSPPDITELIVTNIERTTVSITIGTSEICMAYYMIALQGSATPSLEEVMNQGPPEFETTESIYGVVQIGRENRATVNIEGLTAQTPYVVYVYVVDRGENTNDPANEEFQTADRYPASDFSLTFKQAFLNSAERLVIIDSVAFVSSLAYGKVQERKYEIVSTRLLEEIESEAAFLSRYDPVNNKQAQYIDSSVLWDNSRKLQDVSTTVNLQIITNPDSSVFPTPLDLALRLNTQSEELDSLLSNYDVDQEITATEFQAYVPQFPTDPEITQTDIYWANFRGTLNNYGFIYVVCVEAGSGKPSPYQVYRGYDSKNRLVANYFVEVSTAFTDFDINITSLNPSTEYDAYIVGGSAHPGYPDLMSSDEIVYLTLTTLPVPEIEVLNIVGAPILANVLSFAAIVLLTAMFF